MAKHGINVEVKTLASSRAATPARKLVKELWRQCSYINSKRLKAACEDWRYFWSFYVSVKDPNRPGFIDLHSAKTRI